MNFQKYTILFLSRPTVFLQFSYVILMLEDIIGITNLWRILKILIIQIIFERNCLIISDIKIGTQ